MLDCFNFILVCGPKLSKVHSITNTSDFIDNKVVFISDPFQLSPFDHLLALVQARELNVIIHQYCSNTGRREQQPILGLAGCGCLQQSCRFWKTIYFYIIIRTKRRLLNSGGLDWSPWVLTRIGTPKRDLDGPGITKSHFFRFLSRPHRLKT